MSEPSTISIRICQEGHANALALNKDCSQIAVAGRSILKVYSIDTDNFTEICNMRSGKNQNLSYSSNDVAWSSIDTNLLATAATNGVVSVWDLLKSGRHKQLLVYNEHERTAHTVTFHSTEPHLLISGSQDGTIKCFDLRIEKAVHTYFSNSESVRDVKFSPHHSNIFAAVSENGTVQLWDIKRPDKCQLQFTAHSGPIYTCDWHPNQQWLATGSRDKQIKIWNMEHKPTLEYTIHTIAVVGRVKWRPDRMHHIASCALVVDYSIYIWDIRRPYIPYASFEEHTNVTTGISWKGNDPHVLLSTSKDSTIYKHAFKDALRPSLKANPQAASLNYKGDLLFSYKLKNNSQNTSSAALLSAIGITTTATNNATGCTTTITTSLSSNSTAISVSTAQRPSFLATRLKQHIINEQFHVAKSSLCNYITKSEAPSLTGVFKLTLMNDFNTLRGFACEYILRGKSLAEICEHNANVAKKYNKPNINLLWLMIKDLYSSNKINQLTESRNSTASQNLLPNRILMSQNNIGSVGGTTSISSIPIDGNVGGVIVGGTANSNSNIINNNINTFNNDNNNYINNNNNNNNGNNNNNNYDNDNKNINNNNNNNINNNNNDNNNNNINNNYNNDIENGINSCTGNLDENASDDVLDGGTTTFVEDNNSGSAKDDENKLFDLKHSKSGCGIVSGGGGGCGGGTIINQYVLNDTEPLNEFVFGETELNVSNIDIKSLRNGFLYIGPHDLTKSGSGTGFSLPINTLMGHDLQSQARQTVLSHENRQLSPPPEQPTLLKIISEHVQPQQWKPHDVITECLQLQTDAGDVQTAVCVLIALGDKRCDLPIDEVVCESWLLSYIELLHRHQYWNEANEIINQSWIRSVCELNQQSTTVHTNCGECNKPLINTIGGWYCNKCKSVKGSKCSVCNRIVKGLYAWCQGCSHGGHLEHLKRWFSNHSKCPRCGHLCEYD